MSFDMFFCKHNLPCRDEETCQHDHVTLDSDNAEVREMYRADQADRLVFCGDTPVDDPAALQKMRDNDIARLCRIHEIIDADELRTAQDRFLAAYILQHGTTPEEILLAHQLSSAAAFDGHREARWLSAASLDRFLRQNNLNQCLGTQYVQSSDGAEWVLAPLAKGAVLPDSIRSEFLLQPLPEGVRSGLSTGH